MTSALDPMEASDRPSDAEREHRIDLELVAAANGGDPEAFQALYERHRQWVVQLACRFTGDADLALDVLQDTFLYFLKKFPGFKLTARLQTFLYPAVRNLSLAARRKAQRLQDGSKALESLPAPEPVSTSGKELAAILAVLSEEHREVLLLRFVDQLALAEIAAALAVPLGTVKSRLHSALGHLRADPRTLELFS